MAAADGLRRSVRGLSEAEFRERFGTEEACRKALFEMRWREGLDLPGLRPPRLLRAQDPQAVPVQPLQEAGAADRRHRVPGHQAAADRLVRGHLPPDPGQGRDQLDRARPTARGQAAAPPG